MKKPLTAILLVTCCMVGSAEASQAPAPAGAAASHSGEPAPDRGEASTVPTGSPEDQALWTALRDANAAAVAERARASRLLNEAKLARSDEALAALGRTSPALASRATELQARLVTAWQKEAAVLGTPWPVDDRRACRAQAGLLRSAMMPAAGRPTPLEPARADARRCLDQLMGAVRPLRLASDALEKALQEARTLLATPPATGS